MKRVRCILLLALSTILFMTYSVYYSVKCYNYYHIEPINNKTLNVIPDDKYNKLMIVAHPDDETIWGGGHLAEDDYVVVCITNGNNSTRSKEFENVMNESGDIGIILSYPDKTFGKRDKWDKVYNKIKKDINTLMNYKDWELIVTHNPDGEYGHIHHKMTSSIVTELSKDNLSKLNYFGKYYRKKDIDSVKDELESISSYAYDIKTSKMIACYSSQERVCESLSHMFPYENWYSADAN